MTYASYLIRPIGWLNEHGDFVPLQATEDKTPPRSWSMVYTLHNAATPEYQDAPEDTDLFGDPSGPYRTPPCPVAKIIELYHTHMPTCDRVMLKSATRDAAIRQRWRDVCADGKFDTTQGIEFFEHFFVSAGASKFLTGRAKSRDDRFFSADLLWLMRPTNFVKVCEGKYKD